MVAKKAKKSKKAKKLNGREQAFIEHYVVHYNASKAARDAGFSVASAHVTGYKLLKKAYIKAEIRKAETARADRLKIKADDVLQRWLDIADADPRELVEYRRTCCRHCWGVGFHHQYTQYEIDEQTATARENHTFRVTAWEDMSDAKRKGKQPPGEFKAPTFAGGTGYHRHRAPNPDCPKCFGDGVQEQFIHDTRSLSPQAARLFAGIKETKDGIQIQMHDQQAALDNIAKSRGLLTNKHEHTGKDGAPLPAAAPAVINVQLIAPAEAV